ncbi:MAG: class I SAM-dependent methyltransferase [Coriobacteriia bacterium]|nr:class I SAM-dependent methyltransferase [Coriobacteriia bacterium]
MKSERESWNERYLGKEYAMGPEPSAFLAESIGFIELEVFGRNALDVACGEGRNSIFLAHEGFDVIGVDNSDVGIAKARAWAQREGVQVEFLRLDLREEVPEGPFDLIIVFNFLLRELIPKLYDLLSDGGFLLMESILATPANAERYRAEFVLAPGEIVQLFDSLDGDIVTSSEQPERDRARLLFRKSLG